MTHPRSLIGAFVVRFLDSIISLDSIAKISRLWLSSVAAQTGLGLVWWETPEDTFCRVVAHLYFPLERHTGNPFEPRSARRMASFLTQSMHHSENTKIKLTAMMKQRRKRRVHLGGRGQARVKASSLSPPIKALWRGRHWVWGPNRHRAIKEESIAINGYWVNN